MTTNAASNCPFKAKTIYGLNEFANKCGYFYNAYMRHGISANNGYNCLHPDCSEEVKGIGLCYTWSCPFSYEADDEDFSNPDIDKNGFSECEEREQVIWNSKPLPYADTEGEDIANVVIFRSNFTRIYYVDKEGSNRSFNVNKLKWQDFEPGCGCEILSLRLVSMQLAEAGINRFMLQEETSVYGRIFTYNSMATKNGCSMPRPKDYLKTCLRMDCEMRSKFLRVISCLESGIDIEINGYKYTYDDGKLLLVWGEMLLDSQLTVNQFIDECNKLSEQDLAGYIAAKVLRSQLKKRENVSSA